MNGKELIIKVLRHEKPERIPWSIYTGVHVGSLKGYPADELLKSEDKLFESLLFSNKLYSPDGQPVIFDLAIEAEILGCQILWDKKAPPSVKTHVLEDTDQINLSIPQKTDGRIPIVLNVMDKIKSEVGHKTALYGLICGPFTLASHLRGTNIFMDLRRDPEYVKKLIDFTTRVNIQMAEYYIEAKMDIIAVVDPMVSSISPKQFTQFLSGSCQEIFSYIKSKNVFSSSFVCGRLNTEHIEVMAMTGPDMIAVGADIDILKAKEVTDKHNITMSGNIPLTDVLLLGSQQDNQKYAIDLMDKMGDKNFILATACDIPYETPRENLIGITQAVQNVEKTRTYLKSYVKKELGVDVKLPDYKNLKKPLIEVFTVDSATCAPCTYMKAAADEMKDYFKDKIDVIERKTTLADNISRMRKLNISILPAILINGELKFSSIIPGKDTLKREIEKIL